MNLDEVKIGQKAKIIRLNLQNKEIRRHLLDMGLTRGTEIKVKKTGTYPTRVNTWYFI